MQTNPVELPPGELMKPIELVAAIVKALHPIKTEGLTGMECVVGKQVQVTFERTATEPVFDLDDEHHAYEGSPFTSNSAPTESPPQRELPLQDAKFTQDVLTSIVEEGNRTSCWFPYELTEEDCKELEPLLCCLPPLTYPMTEYAISRFLDAYLALPERPSWIPRIVTADTINRRLIDQSKAADEHKNAIRHAIEEGQLSACDRRRVPTRIFSFETLILRGSAVEYLKRYGLSVRELIPDAGINVEGAQDREEGVYTASGKKIRTRQGTNEGWQNEELEAIAAKIEAIDPETNKKYTQAKVAELIGVTPGCMSSLYKRAKRLRDDKEKTLNDTWALSIGQFKASSKGKRG